MTRCRRRWLLGCALLGCGPDGVQSSESGSDESTHGGETTIGGGGDSSGGETSSSTTESSATTDTGPVADTGTTGGDPSPCLTSANIEPAPYSPHEYIGALRVDAPALARLVFGGGALEGMPYTAVVAADIVDGPWTLAQELVGHTPHDIGDIDGDGRDDLVTVDDVGAGSWWAAMPDGELELQSSFAVAGDADALVRLPGDAIAGIARVESELSIAHGLGDATFGPATIVSPLSPDLEWSAPIVAWDEGIVSVGTDVTDCMGACAGTIVLQLDDADVASPIGMLLVGDELLDVADIDGDGQRDLLLRQGGTGMLRIHRGGQARFDAPLSDVPTDDAAASDVDDDGDLDVYSTQDGAYAIHFNTDFDLSSHYVVDIVFGTPARLGRPVDLDGNGLTEVVLSGNDDRHALLYTSFCDDR